MHIEIMYVTYKVYEKISINFLCTKFHVHYVYLFENVHNTFFQHLRDVRVRVVRVVHNGKEIHAC